MKLRDFISKLNDLQYEMADDGVNTSISEVWINGMDIASVKIHNGDIVIEPGNPK